MTSRSGRPTKAATKARSSAEFHMLQSVKTRFDSKPEIDASSVIRQAVVPTRIAPSATNQIRYEG